MTYYFIRHGESEANALAVAAGWTDSPLTDRGRAQAREAADVIAHHHLTIDLIVSSPLSRAYDTATIIADALSYNQRDIIILDGLKEKSAGFYEGGPIGQIFEVPEDKMQEMGGESAAIFMSRVKHVTQELKVLSGGYQTVLIVAHAGIYRMARMVASGQTDPRAMYNQPKPTNADLVEFPIS